MRRLIAIVILVLIIPAVGIMLVLSGMHNNQFINDSEQYNQSLADKYSALLDKRIHELNMIAASISVASKKASSVFYQGAEAIINDPNQIYLAVRELEKEYSVNNVTEWGVYFYETGRIITPESSYFCDRYFQVGMDNHGDTQEMEAFFAEKNYDYLTINVCKGVDVGTGAEQMMIGVCTTLGKNKDRVMIFFGMSPKYLKDTLAITDNEGIACYLIGNENGRVILHCGQRSYEYLEAVAEGEEFRSNNGIKHKVLYASKSKIIKSTIIAYVTEDSVQSQLIEQVHKGHRVLIFGMASVVLLSLFAALLAYKPIYTLMKDLDYSQGSEIGAIKTILDDRYARITEYEMKVMDLLMDHLLHGVPVAETSLNQLGIDKAFDKYCVMILKDYVPVRVESEKIVSKIATATASRCFVTDWEDGADTIFIVFMQGDCKEAVEKELLLWLECLGIDSARLFDGNTVDQLDLIQNSFKSCLAKSKSYKTSADEGQEQNEGSTAKKHAKLKNEVLQYIDAHFSERDLSQTKVADFFGISAYTLSRLFKNEVGVGFAEYLVAKRIACATELLLSTNDSINDICTASGFSSINHFSKTFKLYKGCSPSQFRKQE